MVFNGRNDLIVCEDCTLNWFDKLVVKGSTLENMDLNKWEILDKKDAGSFKEMENLSLLLINDAGHLVP